MLRLAGEALAIPTAAPEMASAVPMAARLTMESAVRAILTVARLGESATPMAARSAGIDSSNTSSQKPILRARPSAAVALLGLHQIRI